MKKLPTYLMLLGLFLVLGCSNHKSTDDNAQYWETDEFWHSPMDSSALDSIIEGRKHIMSDDGKPYPIDEYEMCIYRYGKPKHDDIPLDSLIGTWHGYGHIYDPRTILTINPDGTYQVTVEESTDDDGIITYCFASEKSGKYNYKATENRLTLLDYNTESALTREAYLKSKNPLYEVRIIYYLEGDTMWLFDGHSDIWPYFRPWVSHEDMINAIH